MQIEDLKFNLQNVPQNQAEITALYIMAKPLVISPPS